MAKLSVDAKPAAPCRAAAPLEAARRQASTELARPGGVTQPGSPPGGERGNSQSRPRERDKHFTFVSGKHLCVRVRVTTAGTVYKLGGEGGRGRRGS